jgi:catechol 2,3-dioxygenase-like lactoylglutathione lyase family enzyme
VRLRENIMLANEKLVAFGATTNAERAAQFYGEVLGLSRRSEDAFALAFDTNGVELRLQKLETLKPQAFTVLGWQVRDVNAVVDVLTQRGVRAERYPGLEQDARGIWCAPSGARVAWFKDPDGNLLSVAQYPAVAD